MFSLDYKSLLSNLEIRKDEEIWDQRQRTSKWHFSSVVRIAMLMRKYQKRVFENYIGSITYNYDLEDAVSTISTKDLPELVHLVRRYELDFATFKKLTKLNLNKLLTNTFNEEEYYWCCLLLKHLCKNNKSIEIIRKYFDIKPVMDVLLKVDTPIRTKDELSWILGFALEQSLIDQQSLETLKMTVISSDMSIEPKAFLLEKLGLAENSSTQKVNESINSKNVSGPPKKKTLAVTKAIQSVKSSSTSRSSEESDFQVLNLASALKNRMKTAVVITTLEPVETNNGKDGDDRSMWRNTWYECLHLYQIACDNARKIMKDDKDNYLPDKLFGNHFFFKDNDLYFRYFINRMVASSLLRISEKQEINDNAIDKLMICIESSTKFEMRVLETKDNITKRFGYMIDFVHDNYVSKLETCECDLAQNLSKLIADKTLKIETKKGWFSNYKEASKKSYDTEEVYMIIKNDINTMRMNAVNAIHHCARRNPKILTNERLKIIQEFVSGNDSESEEGLKGVLFSLLSIVESSNQVDYKGLFETYLLLLKNSSAKSRIQNVKYAINFVLGQSRDMTRCEELFTDEVLTDLINVFSDDQKRASLEPIDTIIEVINSYLEHEKTSLEATHLNYLFKCCMRNLTNQTIVDGVLLVTLQMVGKTGYLDNDVQDQLIQLLNSDSNKVNYVILILSRMRKHTVSKAKQLEMLSYHLESDYVVIADESGIGQGFKFEKVSGNNEGTPISLMVGKMILQAVEMDVRISSKTIEHLLRALNNGIKQASINAAKCLYKLTNSYVEVLDEEHLNKIQMHVRSDVYDIFVYVNALYSRILLNLSKSEKTTPINEMHIDNLSSFELHDSLKLGDQDFAEEINMNVLRILRCEAAKQEFKNEKVFTLFESLLLDEKGTNYIEVALETLEAYTHCRRKIPTSTVSAVENCMELRDLGYKATEVIQNVINNGQVVTIKTLHVFCDYLYTSTNSRRRFRAFKLLSKAKTQQDLPDEIFFKLELTKAGLVLPRTRDDLGSRKHLLKFIKDQTEQKCLQLPFDTVLALEKEINYDVNQYILKIILIVSRNKQILNYDLLNKLIAKFDPKTCLDPILISIFESVARNNQLLSTELLEKLEEALKNSSIRQQVLIIFNYLGQKGEKLSARVIGSILSSIEHCKDPIKLQELLSPLASIINANALTLNAEMQNKMTKITVSGIVESSNSNTQTTCLGALEELLKIPNIVFRLEYTERLVKLSIDENFEETIRSRVYNLLVKASFLTPEMKNKMELANLSFGSNDELLDKLSQKMGLNNNALLEQNYNQLARLLDQETSPVATSRALELLKKSKDRMPDQLVESVALLFESSKSKEIKESCAQLLKNAVFNDARSPSSSYRMKIIKRRLGDQKLHQTLERVLRSELKMNETHLQQLASGVLQCVDQEMNSVQDILSAALSNNLPFWNNLAFVYLVEQLLLADKLEGISCLCYTRILMEHKAQWSEEVVEHMIDRMIESGYEPGDEDDEENSLTPLLAECIVYANGLRTKKCMNFLLSRLESSNEILRHIVFKGLRRIELEETEANSSRISEEIKKFKDWCAEKLMMLSKSANQELKVNSSNLELLEVAISLDSVDLDVLKTNEPRLWKRELIVSSLFNIFEPSKSEQLAFYTNWVQVEEKLKDQDSAAISLLVLIRQRVYSFDLIGELNKTLAYMSNCLPSSSSQIIAAIRNDSTPAESIQKLYFVESIKKKLTDASTKSDEYLGKLVAKTTEKLEPRFVIELLSALKKIDNLRAFEDLIEYCVANKITIDDARLFSANDVDEFQNLVTLKHISNQILSGQRPFSSVFFDVLVRLKERKWSYDQLREMSAAIKSKFNQPDPIQNVIEALKVLAHYKLPKSKMNECMAIFESCTHFTDVLVRLNILAVEDNFQKEGNKKSAVELLAELKKLNADDAELVEYIENDLLREINQIKDDNFKVKGFDLVVSKWSESLFKKWASKNENLEEINLVEAIAVIRKANFNFTGFYLTDVQILSSLIALRTSKKGSRGKLLQVSTGEGKSTIVCILAIIKALSCGQVDVLTSSPVLAERDAKSKEKLFGMFNLKVSHNADTGVYIKGEKDCYKANIVYGEVSQFQFDYLRDKYSLLGTLAGRQCRAAVVDEVDSMLIDDSSKIARLSSTAAGMDHFQLIYVLIWQRLMQMQEKFIGINGKMYFLNGKIKFENGKISVEYVDKNEELMLIDDLHTYLESLDGQIEPIVGEIIEENLEEFLTKKLDQYLKDLLQDKTISIPSNFQEFFDRQRPKWLANAIEAVNYQENVHYVVHEGQIKPVDYFSTGIVQSGTNWSDGLHQFLQLKHNLKMTSETLTTNFLSNVGFIGNYENVFGLTGTLGSTKARKVLEDVYKVNLINVPPLRKKQYLEFPVVVAPTENKWMQDIVSTTLVEVKKDRGILIICETIQQASSVSHLLKTRYRPGAIKLYTMNNANQEKQVEKILPGEIIIATNLAGRGTDINTSEIENTGGLHVLLTFMPSNQRVEDQAFGRTARQGKRGTGQMILNFASLMSYGDVLPREVKEKRDLIESQQLDTFEKKELKLIVKKDELFKKFCDMLTENIRNDIRAKSGWWSTTKSVFVYMTPSLYESNVVAAVEEQWANFLQKLDDGTVSVEQSETECSQLLDGLSKDYKEGSVIKNHYYDVSIGNDFVANQSNPLEAKKYFKKAISDGDDLYAAAHVGLAWVAVLKENENKTAFKKKLLDYFRKASEILTSEMATLNASQAILDKVQPEFMNSDLYKQLSTKTSILGSYLNSIQTCINVIQRSMRLVDLVAKIDNESKQHDVDEEDDKETPPISSNSNPNLSEEYFFELLRDEKDKTVSGVQWNKKASYKLTFNDLTVREDLGKLDQAKQTINETSSVFSSHFKKLLRSTEYSGICLKLKQADLGRLKSLLNEDQEFEELTGDAAIEKLKSARTLFNTMRLTDSYSADLEIIKSGEKPKLFLNRQMNALIKIIEDKSLNDNSLRFNLKIKEINKNDLNTFLRQDASNESYIEASFGRTNYENAKIQLMNLKAKSVTVEVSASKECLNNIKEDLLPQCVKVGLDKEGKQFETIDRKQLMARVEKLSNENSQFYFIAESITQSSSLNLLDHLQGSSFAITFHGISFNAFWSYLSKKDNLNSVLKNFCFDNLNKSQANQFIDVLRKENLDFLLEFKGLSYKQVQTLINKAHIEQEALELSKVKNLAEMFMSGAIPTTELAEFAAKGIEYLLEINEKRFVPWRTILLVGSLGIIQVVIGGVLLATGFGASLGMGFISEGISDLFMAVRGYYTRQLDWSDYAKQKAVSLVISAVSSGFSKLKDAGKGVSTIGSEATKEVLEQTGGRFVRNGKTVGEVMKQTGKNLRSLTGKYIGVKAGEAAAREVLNAGVTALTNMSFEALKPKICESIQHRVRNVFRRTQLNALLRKMYSLDELGSSKMLQSTIDKFVAEIMNPESNFFQKQWNSIASPLLKGILSDEKFFGSGFSMGLRIVGTLQGLVEVGIIIETIYTNLVKKLSQLNENTLTMTQVLPNQIKGLEKERARQLASKLRKFKIIDESDNLNVSSEDIDGNSSELQKLINNFKRENPQENEQAAEFLTNFHQKYVSIQLDELGEIIKSVSDKITEQVIRIIESQMITPWSTLAVSSVTDSLSKRIQDRFLVDKSQNSDSHNEDQANYDKLKQKKENNEELTKVEKAFMSSYGEFRTIGEQVNYNVTDYTIAYSQCEAAYYAANVKKSNGEVSEEQTALANDIRDNKPADMGEIAAMMEANGVNYKVVDDPNYERTEEEIKQGVEVILIEKGATDPATGQEQVGHAKYMNKNGEFVEAPGSVKSNDCVYACVSTILENRGVSKSVQTLREETASGVESNANFKHVIEAKKWIRERYPTKANTLLFTAGKKPESKNENALGDDVNAPEEGQVPKKHKNEDDLSKLCSDEDEETGEDKFLKEINKPLKSKEELKEELDKNADWSIDAITGQITLKIKSEGEAGEQKLKNVFKLLQQYHDLDASKNKDGKKLAIKVEVMIGGYPQKFEIGSSPRRNNRLQIYVTTRNETNSENSEKTKPCRTYSNIADRLDTTDQKYNLTEEDKKKLVEKRAELINDSLRNPQGQQAKWGDPKNPMSMEFVDRNGKVVSVPVFEPQQIRAAVELIAFTQIAEAAPPSPDFQKRMDSGSTKRPDGRNRGFDKVARGHLGEIGKGDASFSSTFKGKNDTYMPARPGGTQQTRLKVIDYRQSAAGG